MGDIFRKFFNSVERRVELELYCMKGLKYINTYQFDEFWCIEWKIQTHCQYLQTHKTPESTWHVKERQQTFRFKHCCTSMHWCRGIFHASPFIFVCCSPNERSVVNALIGCVSGTPLACVVFSGNVKFLHFHKGIVCTRWNGEPKLIMWLEYSLLDSLSVFLCIFRGDRSVAVRRNHCCQTDFEFRR